jgi:Cysteine rich repeat
MRASAVWLRLVCTAAVSSNRSWGEDSVKRLFIATGALLAAPFVLAQAPGGGPPPEVQAAIAAVRTACESDTKQYCADKQGREVFQCLRENSDKVSAGCKDALAKLPARRPPPPPSGQ